ncbi:acyltransferase [Novosphingobium profundi]|uniref:acyltransferase family protein n=1 Tax=Novosphingobium profundi TaxID=1774954 RepID=UPI001BD98A90|nr:acyltransferase [Novosphingobium profundi]MBT0666928.1 acyltransferase [Novosphingobium profundi]
MTIARKLELHDFRPTGFDYMRLVLACLVVVTHAPTIARGEQAGVDFFNSALAAPLKFVLPAFFALSGFLVAGSMERCKSLAMFLMLRGIRIYPALVCEVLLSAFLVGPLVTSLPWKAYFFDPQFFRYLVNVTGHISYRLPGVFATAPKPDVVNGQLWTVPWELICYLCLSVLILLGLGHRRRLILWAIGAMILVAATTNSIEHGGFTVLVGHVWGLDLLVYFSAGVAFHLYRGELPWSWELFGMCVLAACILMFFVPGGQYLALFPTVYATVFLGTCSPRMVLPSGLADCSYGVYLYGYVIQQLVADQWAWSRTSALNVALALPLSIGAGLLSWHLFEKPVMRLLRPRLKAFEEKWPRRRRDRRNTVAGAHLGSD